MRVIDDVAALKLQLAGMAMQGLLAKGAMDSPGIVAKDAVKYAAGVFDAVLGGQDPAPGEAFSNFQDDLKAILVQYRPVSLDALRDATPAELLIWVRDAFRESK